MNLAENNDLISSNLNPFTCIGIAFMILTASNVQASQNRLTFSSKLALNSNNNFLWLDDNEKSRTGAFLEPSLSYENRTENRRTSLGLSCSIEKYNRENYNSENPSVYFSQKFSTERDKLIIDLSGKRQTNRTTEISNTGELQDELSEKNIANGSLSWIRALSAIDSLTFSFSGQNTQYQSLRLVDYNLYSGDVTWERRVSETRAFNLRYKATNYQSEFSSYFPIQSEIIDNISVAPNKFYDYGTASTDSLVEDANFGFSWSLSESTDVLLYSGLSRVNTTQDILTPVQTVVLKFPLSGEFSFDGKRRTTTKENSNNYQIIINHDRINTHYSLIVAKGTRVSDVGSIQNSESLHFSLNHEFTRRDSINLSLALGRLEILDDKVINLGYLQSRSYYQASLGWAQNLTPHWQLNSSIQLFGHQYSNIDIDAKGLSGTMSITYLPSSKFW